MGTLELRVDTDLQTALPAVIDFNYEQLKTELAERLDFYNHLVVTENDIKGAKEDRAKLNKLRTAIDTRRKDIKKEYLKPYNEFEGKIKELTALIDEPIKAIDTQLNTYEEQRKAAKMEKIKTAYEETIDPFIEDIIPLSRILEQSWLNATTSMKKVQEALTNWNESVQDDLAALDMVEEEFKVAVKQKYAETLDIGEAVAYREQLKAARAREEEKKAREAEQVAREAESAAEAESEAQTHTMKIKSTEMREIPMQPEPNPAVIVNTFRLEFQMTRQEAIRLREFLDANNMKYRRVR